MSINNRYRNGLPTFCRATKMKYIFNRCVRRIMNVPHLTPFQQHNITIFHNNVLAGKGVPKQVAQAFYSVPNHIISNSFKKPSWYNNTPNHIVSWSTRDYWHGDYSWE